MPSVNLHWFFPIVEGMALGLGAMTLHEAGHIVAAVILGVDVKRVGLGWRGMYTVREPGTPVKNMLVSLAGPLTNLLLIASWYWWPVFGMANMCVGVTNLLPIGGSDGLRVWRCWERMHGKNLPVP
jgi:membrane-associated protease RseP (regulator of RpoE activity)